MLRLLIARGPDGLPAGELADRAGLPASTTSFHLSALERAGLIVATRQRNQVIYALRVSALRDLLAFLTETCCGGRPELCGDIAQLWPTSLELERASMTPAFNVLFLCTRNSARSIIAEAILNRYAGQRFHAYSAGSDPADAPMPEVIDKLRFLGHDVTGLHSKSWHLFAGPEAPVLDFVIGLCDTFNGQACPDFGDKAVTASWSLPDPAKFEGSPVERTALLNELYGGLYRRIMAFANLPFDKLGRMAVKARLDEIGDGTVGMLARAQGG